MFKFFFQFFPFLVVLLLQGCFVAPLVKGVRGRAIWLMALLFCASKFIVFNAVGGNAFAPELPEKAIWVWNWLYSGMMTLAAFAVPGWVLAKLCAFAARRLCATAVWLTKTGRTVLLVVPPLLAWGLSALGVWNGLKLPAVEERELAFADLPVNLDGYRIVHVSDIHASAAARAWRTEGIVRIVNGLDADLVCLTGDYADGLSRNQFVNIKPLEGLRARDGVLAVTGNHEYYFDTPRWLTLYHGLDNIRWLSNECAFPRPGLAVGGVNDPVAIRFGYTAPDPDAAFASATNGEFRVLLQHRPHIEGLDPSAGHPGYADLRLSGHTHGGVAPVMDRLVATFNGGMVRGTYGRGSYATCHVSSGAGQWAGFPIRFLNDPTVTVLTLRRRASDK